MSAPARTPAETLAYVEEQGVVLAAAKGPVPRLTDWIAGEPVPGSWWSHPAGRGIFQAFQFLDASPEVAICRLVAGKVSYVHRRLWPALARVAARFPADHLALARQEHTAGGRHVSRPVPFEQWMPADAFGRAASLDEQDALRALGPWARAQLDGAASRPKRR